LRLTVEGKDVANPVRLIFAARLVFLHNIGHRRNLLRLRVERQLWWIDGNINLRERRIGLVERVAVRIIARSRRCERVVRGRWRIQSLFEGTPHKFRVVDGATDDMQADERDRHGDELAGHRLNSDKA
jgi:hypothetical protein